MIKDNDETWITEQESQTGVDNGSNMMRYHKRIIYFVIFFAVLFSVNAIVFFFTAGKDLRRVHGKIGEIKSVSYFGRSKYTRKTYYTKTRIWLDDRPNTFYTVESTDKDSLLLKLEKGDEVDIYTKQLYHYVVLIGLGGNMFLLKKNGTIIYDVRYRCRSAAGIYMAVFGAMALFLLIIYLDVVKNISIENWFQRVILKNPDYIRRKG